MKYSTKNPPLKMFMTQSTWYKETRTQTPVGILWHSTGVNNPSLKRYCQPDDNAADKQYWLNLLGKNYYGNDWNHIYIEAGLNFWIGELADGTVAALQTGPWNFRAWGCASGPKGSCNNGWIQFEICEDGLSDRSYFEKVYKEACEMTAYLCQMFNIDPYGYSMCGSAKVPNITCHADAHALGVGSDHGDINHWFPKFGKDMKTARDDVAALLKGSTDSNPGSGDNSGSGTTNSSTFNKGDIVAIKSGAVYYDGKTVPNWVIAKQWYLAESSGDRAVLGESIDGENNIQSPINTKYLTLIKSSKPAPTPPAVKKYTVITNLPRYSSAADAKNKKNNVGNYAPGTYYIYNKYPDGVDGMLNISTDTTGNAAGSWINPAENVKVVQHPVAPEKDKLYRVRKTADDAKTQKGAYKDLNNAKEMADKYASEGYKVFDWDFKVVYTPVAKPEPKPEPKPETPVEPKPETPVKPANIYDTSTKIILDNVLKADLDKNNFVDDYEHDLVRAVKLIKKNNPGFDQEIAEAFFAIAPTYNIDPVMVISQSILETGWFKFVNSSVSSDQHNYCGLGATGGGVSGAAFETVADGVNAQCQHLFAYGCKAELPAGTVKIDPRFDLVTRGVSEDWEHLAGKWAIPGYDKNMYSSIEEAAKAYATYGQYILELNNKIKAVELTDEEFDNYFNPVPPVDDKPPVDNKPPVEDKPPVDDSGDKEHTEQEFIDILLKKIINFIKHIIKLIIGKN